MVEFWPVQAVDGGTDLDRDGLLITVPYYSTAPDSVTGTQAAVNSPPTKSDLVAVNNFVPAYMSYRCCAYWRVSRGEGIGKNN